MLVDLLQGRAAPATAACVSSCATRRRHVKFFDPACDWAPLTDFDYCTEVDRFDFVLRAARVTHEGRRELERIAVPGTQ